MSNILNLNQFDETVKKKSAPTVRDKPECKTRPEVPIWQKSNLTLEEAAAYSGIGINRLRTITNEKDCKFVLFVGTKRLIKRRLLDEYTDKVSVL